jgi:hypothetical protein
LSAKGTDQLLCVLARHLRDQRKPDETKLDEPTERGAAEKTAAARKQQTRMAQ